MLYHWVTHQIAKVHFILFSSTYRNTVLIILIESLCRCSIPVEMGRCYGRRMSQSSYVAQQPSILVGSIATDHSRGINTPHHSPIIALVFNVDCFVCRRRCCAIGLVRVWSWRRSSSCLTRSIYLRTLLCLNIICFVLCLSAQWYQRKIAIHTTSCKSISRHCTRETVVDFTLHFWCIKFSFFEIFLFFNTQICYWIHRLELSVISH